MSTLVVLLPASPVSGSTEFTFALSPDGRDVASHGTAPAALLPQPTGAAAETVAVVPVQMLSWHQVELPPGAANSARLRGVLEGLLEEQLLDEPATLHLALQPGPPSTAAAWVAACDRDWLRAALQALEAAGRPAGRIVPEFAPEGEMRLHAIGEPDQPVLVAAGNEGVIALPLAAASLALLPPAGDVPASAEPAVAASAELLLQSKVTLQQAPQRLVDAARTQWDLAQFDFASSANARRLRNARATAMELVRAPQWRAARIGVVALLLAQVLGLNAWAWKERAALEGKREAVRRTLAETFPQVKVVVDAPVQMEREVAALRQAAGAASGRDLEAMLSAVGTAAPAGRAASGIEFSTGDLRLRGLGLSAQELAGLQARLRAEGYAARLEGDVLRVTAEGAR